MPIFSGRVGAGRKSVRPSDYRTWDFASRKLEEARLSVKMMEDAESRDSYTEAWGRFIDSLQEAWVSFDYEGKKRVTGFREWIVPIYGQRKEDQLLQYLYQARHQSQHGIVPLDWTDPHVKIAPNWSGTIAKLAIFKDGSHVFDARPQDGKSEPTLEYSPGDPQLPIIQNRKYKQAFEPPTEHFGNPMPSRDPIEAARIALDYYDRLFERAKDELLEKNT